MQHPELSLAGKLDSGLTKGLCSMLTGLKVGGLWLLGLLTLASLPWVFFEYDDGLADLSLLEWSLMPVMALLLWRHIRYCQHFSTGFWRGLSRLLIAQGIMDTVGMMLLGACAALLTKTEHPDELLRNYASLQGEISELRDQLKAVLAEALASDKEAREV